MFFNLHRFLPAVPLQQMIERDQDPSRDRQELDRLLEEFRSLIGDFAGGRQFTGYGPLLQGNIQKLSRRCGKASCRCAQGKQMHRSTVFIDRTGGTRKVRTLSSGEYERLRQPTLTFQALRRKRARLTKLFREVLAACDRLCAFRVRQGRRRFRDLLEGKP